MSLQQYNSLMSNLLKEKCTLDKLRGELKERKGKLCRGCKRFRYLVCNCRNKKEREKGTIISQNEFEVLKSRVMQCRVGERTIRRQEVIVVECFKCEEKGHKYRECLEQRKIKEEKRLRRVKEEEAALIGIKRFDHETKVKARSERQNLQTASQLCTKQVGTGEINQIIESLLKGNVQRITKTY